MCVQQIRYDPVHVNNLWAKSKVRNTRKDVYYTLIAH